MSRLASAVLLPPLFLLFASTLFLPVDGASKSVLWVEVKDYIGPSTVEMVDAAVQLASELRPAAILLTLDTFGGAVDSMFKIIETLQGSEVPTIGFVYPAGRQALSAGTYILMASDFAAMAPFTTIGSAQPVSGTTPVTDEKVINAFVEKLVALAVLHQRNVSQAARFITHNDNLLPDQALSRGVIEAIAETPQDLLRRADGVKVQTLRGVRVLDVADANVVKYEPSIRVLLLKILTDPLVSSLFISIGFLALILGLTSPGWGAEVAGTILLLLGLVGQGFNVNLAALILMALGAGMIVYEVYSPGLGAAGVAGIVSLGIGISLMVTQPPTPLLVSAEYVNAFIRIVGVSVTAAGVFFGILVYKVAKVTRKKRVLQPYPTGEGRAVDELGPGKEGFVVVGGEYWHARSAVSVAAGERIRVVRGEGRVLVVEPWERKAEGSE